MNSIHTSPWFCTLGISLRLSLPQNEIFIASTTCPIRKEHFYTLCCYHFISRKPSAITCLLNANSSFKTDLMKQTIWSTGLDQFSPNKCLLDPSSTINKTLDSHGGLPASSNTLICRNHHHHSSVSVAPNPLLLYLILRTIRWLLSTIPSLPLLINRLYRQQTMLLREQAAVDQI